MELRTLARDCLYLNWALPRAAVPELPAPLRYEVHRADGQEWVFASALLFRLSGLRLAALPVVRFSYPQMNLRLYVVDGDRMPAVLFVRTLVPPWVAPVSRLLARQPVAAASFDYPCLAGGLGEGEWTWTLARRSGGPLGAPCRLEVHARLGAPVFGPGPRLGSWERTVDYFRHRRRAYVVWERRLRTITTRARTPADTLPLAASLGETDLVRDGLAEVAADAWQTPHSAWLCPETSFVFEVGRAIALPFASSRLFAAEGC